MERWAERGCMSDYTPTRVPAWPLLCLPHPVLGHFSDSLSSVVVDTCLRSCKPR
jgi:hypothetical protein